MTKLNVGVIFGSRSVEHDVSIITGVQVMLNLDKEKYRALVPEELTNKVSYTKLLMQRAMREIYLDNCAKGVLVANEGKEWGQL